MRNRLTPRELSAIDLIRRGSSQAMAGWTSLGHLIDPSEAPRPCMRARSSLTDRSTPRNVDYIGAKPAWWAWAGVRMRESKRRGDRTHGGRVTHTHREILRVLISFLNRETRTIDPSLAAIAARCRCARSTVQVAISRLVELGLIKRVRRWMRWDTGHGVVAVQDTNAYEVRVNPEVKAKVLVDDTEIRSEAGTTVKNLNSPALSPDLERLLIRFGTRIADHHGLPGAGAPG